MERFIQLNLHSDDQRAEIADLPKPEPRETDSPVISRRLNRIINRAAHKAATGFGRTGSSLFSK